MGHVCPITLGPRPSPHALLSALASCGAPCPIAPKFRILLSIANWNQIQVSKTNVFTLIATLLLGVLLYTIVRFSANLPEPPAADSIRETTAPAGTGPSQPRTMIGDLPPIRSYSELLVFLTARGVDGQSAIAEAAHWLQARGFGGINPLLGVTEEDAPGIALQSLDDATLQTMLEAGDFGASQTLASRVLFTDPFAALELYRAAADQGSVYAIMQIGSLLESLSDISLDGFVADPAYLRNLVNFRNRESAQNPRRSAFSHALAAARDGGMPVIDTEMLNWLHRLSGEFSESEQQSACEQSAELFFEISAKRRQKGLQPLSTDPPPVFLSIPDLARKLPCHATSHPIIQLLNLGGCSSTQVEDNQRERMDLYICKNE